MPSIIIATELGEIRLVLRPEAAPVRGLACLFVLILPPAVEMNE